MEIIKRIVNLDQLNVLDIQYGNNLEEAKYEYKKLKTDLKEINYNIISSELMLGHRFDSYIPSHYGKEQADYNIPHAKRILIQHKLNRKSVYFKFAHFAKTKLRKWTILSYKMHLAYEWAKKLLMDELVVNDGNGTDVGEVLRLVRLNRDVDAVGAGGDGSTIVHHPNVSNVWLVK